MRAVVCIEPLPQTAEEGENVQLKADVLGYRGGKKLQSGLLWYTVLCVAANVSVECAATALRFGEGGVSFFSSFHDHL
jgi:hypothetical protein